MKLGVLTCCLHRQIPAATPRIIHVVINDFRVESLEPRKLCFLVDKDFPYLEGTPKYSVPGQ